MNFKTLAIHAGHDPQEHLGAVMTPIYQTSTFAFRGVGLDLGDPALGEWPKLLINWLRGLGLLEK